jgi:hypothetical protein
MKMAIAVFMVSIEMLMDFSFSPGFSLGFDSVMVVSNRFNGFGQTTQQLGHS